MRIHYIRWSWIITYDLIWYYGTHSFVIFAPHGELCQIVSQCGAKRRKYNLIVAPRSASWLKILLKNKKIFATYRHISLHFASVRYVAKSEHMWRYVVKSDHMWRFVAISFDLKKSATYRHVLSHFASYRTVAKYHEMLRYVAQYFAASNCEFPYFLLLLLIELKFMRLFFHIDF